MQEKVLSCGQLLGLLSLAKEDLDKLSHGSVVRSGTIKWGWWQYQFSSSPYSLLLSFTQVSEIIVLAPLMTCFGLRTTAAKTGWKNITSHMLDCPLHVSKIKVSKREWGLCGCPSATQTEVARGAKSRRQYLSGAHIQPATGYVPLMCILAGSCTLHLRALLHKVHAGNSAAIWNIFKIGLIVMTQSLLDFLWN